MVLSKSSAPSRARLLEVNPYVSSVHMLYHSSIPVVLQDIALFSQHGTRPGSGRPLAASETFGEAFIRSQGRITITIALPLTNCS